MAQDDYIRTALRVPPQLHREIHEAAAKAGHSFNAELLARLQDSESSRQLHKVIEMQGQLLAYLGASVAQLAKGAPAVGRKADAYLRRLESLGDAFADKDVARAINLWIELRKHTKEYLEDQAPDDPLPESVRRPKPLPKLQPNDQVTDIEQPQGSKRPTRKRLPKASP